MLSQQCSNILSLFSCRINDIGSEAHLDDDFSQINAQDNYGSYFSGNPALTVEALKKSTKAKEDTNDAKLKAKEDEAEKKRVADVAE